MSRRSSGSRSACVGTIVEPGMREQAGGAPVAAAQESQVKVARWLCRVLLVCLTLGSAAETAAQAPHVPGARSSAMIQQVLEDAETLEPLRAVIVSRNGRVVAAKGYRGTTVDTPANIKSASKTIVSALVGIAIEKDVVEGTHQSVAELLPDELPEAADPRMRRITVGHLLSMQTGLRPTSGPNYGRWVASDDWVRTVLEQPFVHEPGGAMLYSTGSTHLLSAILTRESGRPALALARDWLGPQDGFRIVAWDRDPQGIYFGGNNMSMSARSLMAFGELYRNGGRATDGRQLIPPKWIQRSWTPRTRSRYTGDAYGYGWFLRSIAGHDVRYAWGYGGQMLYVVPSLGITVAMISAADAPSARSGHRDALHRLLAAIIEASGYPG